jgi:hypothetical protein
MSYRFVVGARDTSRAHGMCTSSSVGVLCGFYLEIDTPELDASLWKGINERGSVGRRDKIASRSILGSGSELKYILHCEYSSLATFNNSGLEVNVQIRL